MKRSTIATLATVAGVALVGGGAYAVTQLPGDEPTASATTEPGIIENPAPSSEPAATHTPHVTAGPQATTAPEDADAVFLAKVREELPPTTQIADAADADLIAAGHEACELLRAGVMSDDIRLIEGEQPAPSGYYMDSGAIIQGARIAYCPDTIY